MVSLVGGNGGREHETRAKMISEHETHENKNDIAEGFEMR
jgi:hypothetical protein